LGNAIAIDCATCGQEVNVGDGFRHCGPCRQDFCLECVRKNDIIAAFKLNDDGDGISEFDASGRKNHHTRHTLAQYNNGISTPSAGIFSGQKSRNSVVVKGPRKILSRVNSAIDVRSVTLGGHKKD